MNPLPPLSAGQRAAAREKGTRVRHERAVLKARLKRGYLELPDVLALAAENEMIARTRVAELVGSMPGVGPVRADQIMEELGIARSRRVRGLGQVQRTALAREFS